MADQTMEQHLKEELRIANAHLTYTRNRLREKSTEEVVKVGIDPYAESHIG